MRLYYTYVLLSLKDGNFYTGSTKDLKRRVREHNEGKERTTKDRKPLKLVYYEAIPSEQRARERERYLKTSWGKRFLRKQLGPG